MSFDVFALRQYLFTPIDDQQITEDRLIDVSQLPEQHISLPVSYTLLETLARANLKAGDKIHVDALLDEIVKSEAYYFPCVPCFFAREGLLTLVPDDKSEHLLNWKSLILQFHLSILSVLGWNEISKTKKGSVSFIQKIDEVADRKPDVVGSRRPVQSGKSMNPGSISFRRQSACIGSFSNQSSQRTGSLRQQYNDIQVDYAPRINRQRDYQIQRDPSTLNLEISPLFDISFKPSLDNNIFLGLICAVFSRGLFDSVLGQMILFEFQSNFEATQIKVPKTNDTSSVFQTYYATLMKTLLSPEEEKIIRNDVIQDNIATVLAKLESMIPFDVVPHTHLFIEYVLAPLCYHENEQFALRAEKMYSMLVNGHGWDLQKTEIVTADQELHFKPIPDHIILVAAPLNDDSSFKVVTGHSYRPFYCGYYDYCYAKLTAFGEYEIDTSQPSGRFIVLPEDARKEIIHELPAFDDKGHIRFDELEASLEELSQAGVTAVHVTGVIERNFLHDLTSVTDHSLICEACGGKELFKQFCEKAKQLSIRVLIDFTPLVCLRNSSRKYSPYATLTIDKCGRLVTADIPETDILLLNYRSIKLWELLAEEITTLCDTCDISGFYLGPLAYWDTVLPRNMKELTRNDPDHKPHYEMQNIVEGTIIKTRTKRGRCGMTDRHFTYSPFLSKLMRTVWSKVPNAFVWMQCEVEHEPFVASSGIIPANYAFRNVMQTAIDHSVHNADVDSVNANEALTQFYKDRKSRNPPGTLNIAPFGAIMDGPFNIPAEGLSLAIDLLFYLSDIPLISGVLETAMFYVNAYSMYKSQERGNRPRDDDFDEEEDGQPANVNKGIKWKPPSERFANLLKNRAGTRSPANWLLDGDIHILPVSYNGKPMRAVLAVARISHDQKRCALLCTSFYMNPLIYEVGVLGLPFLENASPETIVEVKPLICASTQETCYYSIQEINQTQSSLFLDLQSFKTDLYEINLIQPPHIPPNIQRTLMENIYYRLSNAIKFNSYAVLSNNLVFNNILRLVETDPTDQEIGDLVASIPKTSDDLTTLLLESFALATRHKKEGTHLVHLHDEKEIMQREKYALNIIHRIAKSKIETIANLGYGILNSNKLGTILFVAPELGPFSKIGGLSTMVWDLVKELAQLGLDVHCVSPYYNVNNKGQTGYLKQYGIEFVRTIDVYVPEREQIGIHYGVVEGVKCWFLHHYSFFAVPYPTGSSSFKMQLLVVMAKASLEMCCQIRLYPSLIVTNDWMTGLVPAIAKKQFGSVFESTVFLHIIHNLGVGYAGKIWPNNGDTGSLRYIHQLPDEFVVDTFDHSIDPSRCALITTTQWATVSKKYRDELLEGSPYSWILQQFPEPFAYSNGIRLHERIKMIEGLHMNHDEAKRAVQQKYFGFTDDSKCLFIFVGRIVEQKGVHLIIDCFEELNRQFNDRFQFIVGGQAYPDDRAYGLPCAQKMVDLKNRYPKSFWADPSQFFTDGLLCYQAADFTLVPSMFEPSGIVQQEAFVSGCPVIAFRTGGLADTVFEYDREKQTGNGFVFWSFQHRDYIMAIQRAYEIFTDKPQYYKLRENAFNSVLTVEEVAVQWSREFARLFYKIFEKPEENEQDKH